MIKYDQTNTGTGLQFMDFILADGLEIGESVAENTYAEFSADVKLQNKTTGINLDLANKDQTGNNYM